MGDSGPALGMDADSEYPQICETLTPGEAVLLYSDGFEWAFEGRTSDVVGQVNVGDRRRPNDRYLQAFGRDGHAAGDDERDRRDGPHLGGDGQAARLAPQPDDVTLLAVCYRGCGTGATAEPASAKSEDKPVEPTLRKAA